MSSKRLSLAPISDNSNRRNSLTRRSSIGATRKSVSNEMQPNPDFKILYMKNLLNFLTTHNFNHQLTTTTIQKPSLKDFTNILIFLFVQVDKFISLKGKFDDDVVTVFKNLKYPNSISKQNLLAPGTPHTWPTLLATLHWLVDLLNYIENSTVDISPLQEYLFKSYNHFNKGEDEQCLQLYEEFVAKIRHENELISSEITIIEQETVEMKLYEQQLEKELSIIPGFQRKLSDYQSDYNKFQNLIIELTNHQTSLEKKEKQMIIEIQELDSQIRNVTKEVEQLQNIISVQSITAKEAETMKLQQIQLQREQEIFAIKLKEAKDIEINAEEILRSAMNQLRALVDDNNTLCDGLLINNSSDKKNLKIAIDIK